MSSVRGSVLWPFFRPLGTEGQAWGWMKLVSVPGLLWALEKAHVPNLQAACASSATERAAAGTNGWRNFIYFAKFPTRMESQASLSKLHPAVPKLSAVSFVKELPLSTKRGRAWQ